MGLQPIEYYGAVENNLIGCPHRHEWLDPFLSYSDFDWPTVFAALLDDAPGGSLQIKPDLERIRVRQLWLTDSASCEGPSDLEAS
jgi:hypothetical protein